jgi:hypothetical protein
MARDATTRASDADRNRIAAALSEHLAVGRLAVQEFDDRLEKAYAAKTLDELDPLTADLPGTDLDQLPEAMQHRSAARPPMVPPHPPGSIRPGQGRFSPA